MSRSNPFHGLDPESYWWAYDLGVKAFEPSLRRAHHTTRLKRCVFRPDTPHCKAWEDGWYDTANLIPLAR